MSQTDLIQTIQFSIRIVFIYAQLNVKIVPFQTIQFSVSTVSISKSVLFQAIHFSISSQFSSIWPIEKILSGATTLGQRRPGSNGNEGVLHIPQSSSITWNPTIRFFSVLSRTPIGRDQQRCSLCILQPQPTGQ